MFTFGNLYSKSSTQDSSTKRSYKKTYLTVSLNNCVQFTKKDDIHSPSDLYNVAWLWPSLTLCNRVHKATIRQRDFPTIYWKFKEHTIKSLLTSFFYNQLLNYVNYVISRDLQYNWCTSLLKVITTRPTIKLRVARLTRVAVWKKLLEMKSYNN